MKVFSFLGAIMLILVSLMLFIQCPPEIPDEIAPVVNIIYPVDGQAVSGTIKVSVAATDETDLKQINLFIDGEMKAVSENQILEYMWNTTPIADNRNHSLYATATDRSDNNGFSGNVIVRVVTGSDPDTLAPVITILNPVNLSIVVDTVNVVSQVYDDTQIDKVEYFVDGELIHTTTQTPYSFKWIVTNYINGSSHSLFGQAYDMNQNSSVSNVVTVTVQNTVSYPDTLPPVITILNPVNLSTVVDSVNVVSQVSDNTQIDRVEYFVDGELIHTATQTPYSFKWIVTNYVNGSSHSLFGQAYDTNQNSSVSNVVTVTVQNTVSYPDTLPPVITILNPVNLSTVGDTVNVVSQVYDDTQIDRVEYFVDGELIHTTTQMPYNFQWILTNYVNGSSHSLFGQAYDTNQNSSVSNVVTVTVQNADITPPTVLIIYPASGSIFTAGTVISVTVDAQDNIGIQRVEIYIDGELKITDTSSPYSYDWDTTGYGDGGIHTIYVKAFDFAGNNNVQLVTVTVNP
jgi:hypothetical protein